FLNKERIHFSFDERRYFTDEKSIAKVMRMKLQVKERVFFVVMIVLYLAAIIVYFSGNNEFGIWLLMSVVILQLIMNMVTDFSISNILRQVQVSNACDLGICNCWCRCIN